MSGVSCRQVLFLNPSVHHVGWEGGSPAGQALGRDGEKEPRKIILMTLTAANWGAKPPHWRDLVWF